MPRITSPKVATPMNPQDFREVMDKAGLLPTRQYD